MSVTRLRAQDGFTMILALGVLLITSLLTAAIFTAVQGDASLTRADLNGKQAYSAAQAGVQAYLNSLNLDAPDSQWFKTCAHDMSNGDGSQVKVPGATAGARYSYLPVPIAPHVRCEPTDPVGSLIDPATGTLRIAFTGSVVKPGKTRRATKTTATQTIVAKTIVASFRPVSLLPPAWYTVKETIDPQMPLPADNSDLLPDATSDGTVLTGTTTLTVNGTTATGSTCTTLLLVSCTPVAINLVTDPIIYVANGSGCTSTAIAGGLGDLRIRGTGPYYGPCGNIYLSGSYSTPLTIAAANDVIVTGSLTNSTDTGGTSMPTGPATLGLVANQRVRVACAAAASSVTIDGAIIALGQSFVVDKCAARALTVHGAIAQRVSTTDYSRNLGYDNRLALVLPPYLFDLQNTSWSVFRETLTRRPAG